MRYQTLQASRGIAALLVVAYHASESVMEDPRFWSARPFHRIFDFGHASVYFFFVLSGFIIFAAHLRDIDNPLALKTYLMRRFIRVYPIYWIVLFPIAFVYWSFPSIAKVELSAPSVIFNSFLLVGRTDHASLAVAWTLFHEIAFYIMFGLLMLNRRLGSITLGCWWVVCAVGAFAPHMDSSFYFFHPLNLLFAGGMAVFSFTRRYNSGAGVPLVLMGCALFSGTGLYETQIEQPRAALLLYGIASLLIVAGLVWIEQVRPVSVPAFLALLGDASYCIYLCHYPALSVIARIWLRIFGRDHADISFLCIIILATIPGVLLHLTIEKPLLSTLHTKWHNHMRLKSPLANQDAD